MIGKGKSISHTKASIEYGWNQEKNAKVIFKQNLISNKPSEITKEIQFIQSFNNNCKRNTFSFVLSPTIEDGKKLDIKMLKEITIEFMKDLKLINRQAVAFVHLDKNHKHIHLYVNRIDFKGKAYNDSFIGKKSQKSAERVALKLGLKTVKQVQLDKKNNTKEIRKTIYELHKECMLKNKPKDFTEYIRYMNKLHVEIIPSISKSNQLQGFKYKYDNQIFKGSAVHRELSINKVAIEMKYNSGFINNYHKNEGIQLLNKLITLSPALLLKITNLTQNSKLKKL